MGEFVCRVADANGRVYSHVEAAGTQAEARQKLADRGLYVYSVENRGSLLSGFQRGSSRQVGGSDFLILNQQFNTLIKAGLPILRALDLLTERAASPRLRPVVAQIRDRVREGKSLSEAVDEAGVCGHSGGDLPGYGGDSEIYTVVSRHERGASRGHSDIDRAYRRLPRGHS